MNKRSDTAIKDKRRQCWFPGCRKPQEVQVRVVTGADFFKRETHDFRVCGEHYSKNVAEGMIAEIDMHLQR